MNFLNNIFGGASTVLDIIPKPQDLSDLEKSSQKDDYKALSEDWTVVGKDIEKAIKDHRESVCN